ncbi:hypothetical protein BH10PSE17_BH10PSE17_04990 [soil metagenome]
MPTPNILVVEDNLVMMQFIIEALEPLGIDVREAMRMEQAQAELSKQPADMILTDLNLAGGTSAWPLIEALSVQPAYRDRVVVYSGTISDGSRARLAALGVTRIIPKPASFEALFDCASEVLGLARPAQMATSADTESLGLERFGGNRKLYERFRGELYGQLDADIATVSNAVDAADWKGAETIAHSLKSALTLVGQDACAAIAAEVEHAAERGDVDAVKAGWIQLEPLLVELQRSNGN